jgi:hypothetical protein
MTERPSVNFSIKSGDITTLGQTTSLGNFAGRRVESILQDRDCRDISSEV